MIIVIIVTLIELIVSLIEVIVPVIVHLQPIKINKMTEIDPFTHKIWVNGSLTVFQ